jgi:type II restriction/modification system DNA methylase subunit YeeA
MSANFRCADALFTDWPEVEFIVSNPPFLGGSRLWKELGRQYQQELWKAYEGRVPGFADLCCYWFEKARQQIELGKCKRAGLLATQGIRGGANREVLKRIKGTGDIFFAMSDRDWTLDGANVHVSMIGFDDGTDDKRTLDGHETEIINANLTSHADVVTAKGLASNRRISFQGSQKIGPFDIPEELAVNWLSAPNPHGLPNSDVLKLSCNGMDVARRPRSCWMIDFGTETGEHAASLYEKPFQHALSAVKPEREKNNREAYRKYWWRHGEPRIAMRASLRELGRFLVTPEVSKHAFFAWLTPAVLPDKQLIVFARSDDYFFGVLQSRFHEVWALAQGTQLREKESGFRYTPTTCFDSFPLPRPTPAQEGPIAAAAKELNELRERWLNPPEWTVEKILEFPGSVNGPWSRYIVPSTINAQLSTALVRYPRLEPRDAECAARLKKRTLTELYNKRQRGDGDTVWLDFAHKKLDAAVAAAYGWPADLSDEQILDRLLALNLQRAAEEAKAAKAKIPKTSRAERADEFV